MPDPVCDLVRAGLAAAPRERDAQGNRAVRKRGISASFTERTCDLPEDHGGTESFPSVLPAPTGRRE